MEEIVSYIIKKLVKKQDMVEITSKIDGKYTVINVKADKDDLGRIIGKNGKTINSIRTIVKSLSSKSDNKFIIKVGE
ncbi:MAG: KH domain-containing protein [Clostridia bacterium]|nr:KH domain-containing protein [Clostridia bacterium]